MAANSSISPATKISNNDTEERQEKNHVELQEVNKIISTLPRAKGFLRDYQYQYQGFWFHAPILNGILIAQNQKYNQSSDHKILLATYPKSGTTWGKALLFAITTRRVNNVNSTTHPLLTSNPHALVPFICGYANNHPSNPVPESTSLLATHMPFHLLPNSIQLSNNHSIVYIHRDPKDVLISFWTFGNHVRSKDSLPPLSIDEAVDMYCEGKSPFGPYWDQFQSYRDASLKMPGRVLFMCYEEMMRSPIECLKKLATFVGHPFSAEEEKDGVPESIVDLCSFKKMKDLEINQPRVSNAASAHKKMTNNLYFRKGEIGDHRNHLTAEMIDNINEVIHRKCGGIGNIDT